LILLRIEGIISIIERREEPIVENFKIIYKILNHLERMMDCEHTDISAISHERLGITKERWEQLLILLQDEGYIKGIVTAETLSDDKPHIAKPIKPKITLKGLEYLAENSLLKKAGDMLKGIEGTEQ